MYVIDASDISGSADNHVAPLVIDYVRKLI